MCSAKKPAWQPERSAAGSARVTKLRRDSEESRGQSDTVRGQLYQLWLHSATGDRGLKMKGAVVYLMQKSIGEHPRTGMVPQNVRVPGAFSLVALLRKCVFRRLPHGSNMAAGHRRTGGGGLLDTLKLMQLNFNYFDFS